MNFVKTMKQTDKGITVPGTVKYIEQPSWDEICSIIEKNDPHQIQYVVDETILKSSFKGVRLKLKLNVARQALMKQHLVNFLYHKDAIIMKKNKIINDMNIYKHDLDLNIKSNIIHIYESQKGCKRFASERAYKFYTETGKQPYRIIST